MPKVPLIVLIFSLFLVAGWTQLSPTRAEATVARYWFTPEQGVPGTLVLVEGMHYFSEYPSGIPIHIGPSNADGSCEEYTPVGQPIARAYPQNGSWGITIRIPSTLPSGKPVTAGTICIMAPSEARSSQPFTILNKLPGSGEPGGQSIGVIAFVALALMLFGLQVRGIVTAVPLAK